MFYHLHKYKKKIWNPLFYLLLYMTHSFQNATEYIQSKVQTKTDTSALRSNPVK